MTKFGIPKREVGIELGDENGIFDYINENFFVEVAVRSDKGIMYWTIPTFNKFSDDIRVYALDNNQQGIYTIGDIKREIEKQ
jgi:hypothetical protein